MIELSSFFNITIRMQAEAGAKRNQPRFHAYYGDAEAVYEITDFDIVKLSGHLSEEQEHLVLGWAELRRSQICLAWNNLLDGKLDENLTIKPIR